MKELDSFSSAVVEEKKSKFISHLVSYQEFDRYLIKLKEEHPKARHFVYAFRYMNDQDQVIENCSDDGEPKGSSGRPILNVLKGHELINAAVIVVRYFGGTKLGVGGLVRAYTDAAGLAIQQAKLREYIPMKIVEYLISYSEQNTFLHLLGACQGIVLNRVFDENNVKLRVNLPLSRYEFFEIEIRNRRLI